MSPAKSEGSSHHKGKDPIIKKSPFEKERDKEVSTAEMEHSDGEETIHVPNRECLPLLNLWYNAHIHFLVVASGYTYPPPDQVWLFLEWKVTKSAILDIIVCCGDALPVPIHFKFG